MDPSQDSCHHVYSWAARAELKPQNLGCDQPTEPSLPPHVSPQDRAIDRDLPMPASRL